MALRNIREFGDPVLNKVCLPIKEMTDRNRELISDMFETLYEANGVGLAAPQVGVLKRVFVIDTTGENPLVFINPEIVAVSGSQTGYEGCLSLPGKTGTVTRPQKVKAKPLDINMVKECCGAKLLVTVEEHSIIGGLGSAVAEAISAWDEKPRHVIIGVKDDYIKPGEYNYLVEQYGLTSQQIVNRIIKEYKGEILCLI